MREETNNSDLVTSTADGQRYAGERQRSGSPEKSFHTQDAGKRRGKGSSNGIKKLFTSPFPYLFMAVLLSAILLFYEKRDASQTIPVREDQQPAQTQSENLQDGLSDQPQEDIPQTGIPQTDYPQTDIQQSEIPESGIPEGNVQSEVPGDNLQGGYQAVNPQQEIPADEEVRGGENTDSADTEGDSSVPVESITITAGTDVMAQCDTLQLTATVSPSNAGNTALLWFSDDDTIARVSQDGLVTSVSAGYTVISAVSSNGVQTDFPISVSSSRKVMTLTVSTECTQNDKVGSNWTYRYLMNGTPIHAVQNMMVEAGKTLRLESEIIEHDEQPDLGSAENDYYVEQSDLEDGFEVRQEVYVQENRPKLAGNTASFVVIYRFSDAVE